MYCTPSRAIFGPYGQEAMKKGVQAASQYTRLAAGPFVSGYNVSRCKKDSLFNHQKSKGHQEAVLRKTMKEKTPGCTEAEKIIQKLNESSVNRLTHLFRNAHAIAKKSRPFSDMVWLTELDNKKGVDIGNTYHNDKACRQFDGAIAQVERSKIEVLLRKAKFLSVLSDGSSDISVVENEIVFIRFAVHGVVYVYFIALVAVSKADAAGIYEALMKAFRYLSLPLEDVLKMLIAYCCDGASVNTGLVNGVIALMRRRLWPGIILIKCMVHRVELAYKDSVKKVKVYEKVNTLLSVLFAYYHQSCLQRSNLENAFQTLGQPMVNPKRVGGTRWLSHTAEALTNLFKGYKGFVLHLGQSQDGKSKMKPKAQSLLKLLTNRSIIVFSHFLLDLLNVLKTMSLGLQEKSTSLYECHKKLEISVASLEKMKSSNKPNDLNWEVINEQYSEGHQNVLALVDLVFSLPASTAECERGFSHMKLTKTDSRNKLKSTTMSDLMMVKLVSDDIASFNPLPAIHQWNSSSHRARRASYMQTKQKAGQTGLPQLPEVPDLNEVVEAAGESSAAREPNKYYDSDQDSDFSDLGFSDSESDNLDLDEAAGDLD